MGWIRDVRRSPDRALPCAIGHYDARHYPTQAKFSRFPGGTRPTDSGFGARLGRGLGDGRARRASPGPGLRLVFPAAVQPEILLRVAADDPFQGRSVSLGQQFGVVGGPGPFLGLDDLFTADLVAEPSPDPPRISH